MTVPSAAYAAALAGFAGMNVHRLGALLRRHSPEDAWRVVQGQIPAEGLVARVLADRELRSLWQRCANAQDRKSTRLNSSHERLSRMPSSA